MGARSCLSWGLLLPEGHRRYIGHVANLGGSELFMILLIVLVLFGGAKLPQLARSLGQAQREFKRGVEHGAEDEPSDKTA